MKKEAFIVKKNIRRIACRTDFHPEICILISVKFYQSI